MVYNIIIPASCWYAYKTVPLKDQNINDGFRLNKSKCTMLYNKRLNCGCSCELCFRYFFCMAAGGCSLHTWQGVLASGGGKHSQCCCSSLPLLSRQNKNPEFLQFLHPELLQSYKGVPNPFPLSPLILAPFPSSQPGKWAVSKLNGKRWKDEISVNFSFT